MTLSYKSRVIAAAALGMEGVLPGRIRPLYAAVRLTDRCNCHCITCGLPKQPVQDSISTDRAIELMREFRSLRVERVDFVGGETLLREDFFEILNTMRPEANNEEELQITVYTNGLLVKQYADQISRSPITYLGASLEGGRQNNDRIRGIPGHYETTLEGLSRVRGKTIKILHTLTNSSADDLEDLIKLCRDRNYEFFINLPHARASFYGDEASKIADPFMWPDLASINKIVDILQKHAILDKQSLEVIRSYLLRKKLPVTRCVHGYLTLIVRPNGDISAGDYVLPPVGNILRKSVRKILESKGFSQMALRMFRMQCPGCTSSYATSVKFQYPLPHVGKFLRRTVTGGGVHNATP